MNPRSRSIRLSFFRCLSAVLFTAIFFSSSVFAEKNAKPLDTDGMYVSIPKNSVGKEYLMCTSLIPQSNAATSHGLIGRIVSFELFPDGVDMYESTQGKIVTDDLPAKRLVARFPIISEDNKVVTIDFNDGMRRLLYAGWYSMSRWFNASMLERAAEMPQSRVFDVKKNGDQLVIRQAAQVRSRSWDPDLESKYEIRYFIEPYLENKKYEAIEAPRHETRYAKFFEVFPTLELETGRPSIKMSRFDISKPITFYYSANTPADYEEAVKEGILYWNKAFGKEVIKAEKAEEGVTAPDVDRNIIQWVPWDNAGFAYADLLPDPRTGESLHGQVYLTSVFAIGSKARARAMIRALSEIVEEAQEESEDGDDDGEGEEEHHHHHGESMMGVRNVCRMDTVEFATQLSEGLKDLLANKELTDAAILKISQDYVREVASHEVGHVLGLRHNFSGSSAATLSPKELKQFMDDYISGEDLEKYNEELASSSCMEYNAFYAAVFVGWQMKNLENALPHDEAAIKWGYFEDKKVVEDKMLFGPDEVVGDFADVTRFDYGSDPIITEYQEISSILRNAPNNVIERFIRAKAPRDPRDSRPLETVNVEAKWTAEVIGYYYGNMLQWLKSETRSRKVENDFDYIGESNENDRIKAHWESLKTQLESLGGIDRVAFEFLPVDLGIKVDKESEDVVPAPQIKSEEMAQKVKDLLDTPAYTTFIGLDEKEHTWTDEEKELIVERATTYFQDLEEAVLNKVLSLYEDAPRDLGLKAMGSLSEDDPISKLEKRITELAKAIVTTQNEETTISGKVDKARVEVVDFKYSLETRMAAAKALNDGTGSFKAWSKEAKQGLHADLKKVVEESLNIKHFKKFEDKLLSRSLREWYLQQKSLLKLLPPAPKASPSGPSGGAKRETETA